MIKHNFSTLFIFVLLLSSQAIWGQKNFQKRNFADMYDYNKTQLHPLFQCYHDKDSSSLLFYQIDYSELTYNTESKDIHKARVHIYYEIYYNYKAKNLLDSGSVFLTDTANYKLDNSSIGFFNIPISYPNRYVVYLKVTDLNSKNNIEKILDINKTDHYNAQNFYLKGDDNLPLLQSYVNKMQPFQLISQQNQDNYINIRYFKPNNIIARPPMLSPGNVNRIIRADTNYIVQFNEGYSNLIKLQDQGYYFFYFKQKPNEGYTLFQFASHFPYVTNPMQMLMPLRYISSKKEFLKLFKSKNKKVAIEQFWIKISGGKERAKSMIKLYYNRVQNANIFFTSDKEGWMTDRGMIYIIYGAPDIVYHDAKMETWKYGGSNSSQKISFDFYKSDNPFTTNEYILQRNINYALSWNKAIEIWRR